MAFLSFDADKHEYTVNGRKLPSVTEICGMLFNYGEFNPTLLKQASRRGTIVHDYCATIDYVNDGIEPEGIEVEPELSGYVLAYMHFLRDYKPEWEMIEQKVYSEELGVAGTLDRLGTIDGKPYLVDIKTTSSPTREKRVAWACQLAGYALILDLPDIKRINVVLKKDGKYQVINAEETEEKYGFYGKTLFRDLLNIWEILKGES